MKKKKLIYRLCILSILCLIFEGCTETSKGNKVLGIRGSPSWHTFEAIRACIEKRQTYKNCIESGDKKCFRTSC